MACRLKISRTKFTDPSCADSTSPSLFNLWTQISALLYTLSGSSVEHPCNNFCPTGFDRQTCIRAPCAPFSNLQEGDVTML
ncbi:unnamed protein product [Sphagnum compactum]